MTRKKKDIQTGMKAAEITVIAGRYLVQHGFVSELYRGNHINYINRGKGKKGLSIKGPTGETVWRRGSGAMFSPLFLKLDTQDGFVHLEAWGLSRIVENRYPFPYAPRVGEGVLEVPGLKRSLIDLEGLLVSDGKKVPEKNASAILGYVLRRRPYSWQGWATVISFSLIFIISVFLQGTIWKGLTFSAISGVILGTVFILFYVFARDSR